MQLHLGLEAGREEGGLVRLHDRLETAFGPPAPHVRRDPVAHLVRGLIAARTQEAVADEVLMRLRTAFRPLGRIGEARMEEVLAVIAPVAHAERKAPQLIEAIRRIGRLRGVVTLDFLAAWPVDDAMIWLQELPGVDAKVAAEVLNLSSLNRRVLVVDAHVRRVAARTGLVEADADRAQTRDALTEQAPEAWGAEAFSDLHRLMRTLGRLHCHKAMPECPACPLMRECPEGRLRFGRSKPPGGRVKPGRGPPILAANQNEAQTPQGGWDAYLRRRVARIEQAGRSGWSVQTPPAVFGAAALDGAFAAGGLPPGAHQTAPAEPPDLAAPLILPLMAAAGVSSAGGVRLLVVREHSAAQEGGEIYGPGLEALGAPQSQVAFVRVADGAEVLRVTDEALKRRAAPVVLAELRRGASLADLSATRRLNLAAQRRGAFLFLITPDLLSTSAALTRWRVASTPSRAPPGRLGPPAFRLSLVKNRLGRTGEWFAEWSARERRFSSAIPLASSVDAAPAHRSAAARTA